ncbi:hypothetical protein AGMMS4957_18060 [Bacteroidia bacterium]|nr:hypothetical protein AGMMS4957_18060 [Bacteroidia bacterium]
MAQQKFVDKSPQEIIDAIFEQYRKQFDAALSQAETLLETKRIYDAGQKLELAFKNFFLQMLPEYVGITRGFVFDTECERHSNEIDLIFYDKRYFSGFPINEQGDDVLSYISIDVVLGIAQVKKTLTLDTWGESINNLNSVYSLKRQSKPNQMHYDSHSGGTIQYNGGISSTERIFSCILSGKNDMFYKIQDGIEVQMNNTEIKKYILTKTNEEKYHFLRINMPIDLIYTLDGTLAYAWTFNEKTNTYQKDVAFDILGENKVLKWMMPLQNKPIIYTFDNRLDKPNTALGFALAYLNFWCKPLIKSTPKIEKILANYFSGNCIW